MPTITTIGKVLGMLWISTGLAMAIIGLAIRLGVFLL